jgi:hypothetical protein
MSENLDITIGLISIFGLSISLALIAAGISLVALFYFKRPYIASLMGSLSSIAITLGVIGFFLKRE